MEEVIELFYSGLRNIQYVFILYQEFALGKWPNSGLVSTACHILNASIGVYGLNAGKPPLYWLHSLAAVVLTAFGGGITYPVLLGRPSVVLAADHVVPMCIFFWYITHHFGLVPLLKSKPFKTLWIFGLALFKTNSSTNAVKVALSVLKPGIYYPTPLMGPILCGVLAGCFGQFMPLDKGFGPIKTKTSWGIQAAFLTTCFYYFMVKDEEGFLGRAARSVLGNLSERTVITIIYTVQLISFQLQTHFSPDANLFTPFHKLGYLIFQVQGPIVTPSAAAVIQNKPHVGWDLSVRRRFESFVDYFRALVVVVAVLAYAAYRVPPVSLPAVVRMPDAVTTTTQTGVTTGGAPYVTLSGVRLMGLSPGQAIGHCQWTALLPLPFRNAFPAAQLCENQQYALRLEEWRYCTATAGTGTCSTTSPSYAHLCAQDGCDSTVPLAKALQLPNSAITNVRYRLAVRKSALPGKQPSFVTFATEEAEIAKNEQLHTNLLLPVSIKSMDELNALDPQYDSANVDLFVANDSTLYLLSSVEHTSGSSSLSLAQPSSVSTLLQQPTTVTGRLIWSGRSQTPCKKGTEAVKFVIDSTNGAPTLQCSDGTLAPISF